MGCKVANFILFQRLQLPNTPPFLGLLPLPEASADKAIERTRAFLSGRADRLHELFSNFTYLSGWLVTHALNDNYGDDGRSRHQDPRADQGWRLTDPAEARGLGERQDQLALRRDRAGPQGDGAGDRQFQAAGEGGRSAPASAGGETGGTGRAGEDGRTAHSPGRPTELKSSGRVHRPIRIKLARN